MDNILLTICARGSSKGIKGKNIKLLNGKPLIFYTIKQALNWGKAKHVIVSTDSKEIASIAKSSGAEVPFLRPKELAADTSSKLSVLRHALAKCEKIYQEKYSILIDLQVTAPVRTTEDIDKAIDLFRAKKPQSLFSVTAATNNPYFTMVELTRYGFAKLCKKTDKQIFRRQDSPKVFAMNGSIYMYDRNYLINKTNLFPIGKKSIIYEMNEFAGVDIDREIDFKFIEFLSKEKIVKI
jgi:CMP-N-acetylneuraminic acid synthetase